MKMTSFVTRVAAAAAAVFVTTGALAEGTVTPELGWGQIAGGRVDRVGDSHSTLSFNAALGYRADNGLGVRALWMGAFDIWRDADQPTFNDFYGVQATGQFPLASQVDLTAGLGLGRTNLDTGVPGNRSEILDGIVSAGLQYRPFKHFAVELHFDYLTRTHERNLILMWQVPF